MRGPFSLISVRAGSKPAFIVPSNLLLGEGRRSRKHCEWEWTTNVEVLVAKRKGVDEVSIMLANYSPEIVSNKPVYLEDRLRIC